MRDTLYVGKVNIISVMKIYLLYFVMNHQIV